MAQIRVNPWTGIVLVLDNSEVSAMKTGFGVVETVVDAALSAAKITGPYAWLVKGVVKGLFMYRKWNIDIANRRGRGVFITFSWLLLAAFVLPSPITGPFPSTILSALFNPLYVFIGGR